MSGSLVPDADHHKLTGLDHLRAVAIIFVVLFHYPYFYHPKWLKHLTLFGWTGVDLFFVLSGFLIASQLFGTVAKGKAISLSEFYIKRSFRILPAYLAVVALYFVFPVLWERPGIAPLWRFLTFTQNFGLQQSTFSHAWSLCVEEQFYLLFPLFILLFNRFKIGKLTASAVLALFVAGFFFRYWSYNILQALHVSSPEDVKTWVTHVYYPTYNRLDGLLVGISVAGLFAFYPRTKAFVNRYANMLLLTGIALVACVYFFCADRRTLNSSLISFPLIAITWGFIVAAAVCPSCVLFRFKSKLTARLATLSYAIYLVHKMVIYAVQDVLGKLGMNREGVLMMLICFAASLAAALLLHYSIENPFLRLRDKALKRLRSKKASAVPELQVV